MSLAGRLLGDGGVAANAPFESILADEVSRLIFVLDLFARDSGRPRSCAAAVARKNEGMYGNQTLRLLEFWRDTGLSGTNGKRVFYLSYRAIGEKADAEKLFDLSAATVDDRWQRARKIWKRPCCRPARLRRTRLSSSAADVDSGSVRRRTFVQPELGFGSVIGSASWDLDRVKPEQKTSAERLPQQRNRRGIARALGLGVVTGAADDDCSAIGTYASAGAQFGTSLLWMAPVMFPMMFTVVYLSSKLGQVTGKGLFHVIRENFPRWILWPALIAMLIGNVIGAAADIGAMAAGINLFVSIPSSIVVIAVATSILWLQIFGSYSFIKDTFRWLALALFAYVGAALLAQPDPAAVLWDTFVPKIQFSREFLSIVVAIIGTSLSAYLYTWQSNVEVEEKIAEGERTEEERRGASSEEIRRSSLDILLGMLFSNVIMYFIILATGSTLHKAGQTHIETATQAAEALQPLAGPAAGALFAVGIVAVGFLAVPIITTGAAYDLCQVMGWKASLHARPREAKKFYGLIAAFTTIAIGLNFLGFNPMRALVYAGIVQGFSTPPLLLIVLLMTSNRRIMGNQVNSFGLKVLGWLTVTAIFAASFGLLVTWFL